MTVTGKEGRVGEAIEPMTEHEVLEIFQAYIGDVTHAYEVPPPSFVTMQGQFLEINPEEGKLIARFPVLPAFRNPYGAMQGGMIAAAIDNAIGPLSMLYSPPNVTRRMEIKYSRPVDDQIQAIHVHAQFVEQQDAWLRFRADVRSDAGVLLARARSRHWILTEHAADAG